LGECARDASRERPVLTKQQAAVRLGKTLPMITKLQERGYLRAVLRSGKRLLRGHGRRGRVDAIEISRQPFSAGDLLGLPRGQRKA
jgi:hypothetical protein